MYRPDIDRTGDAAGDEIRGLRLVDLHRGDDFGREHFPAYVAIRLGRGDLASVHRSHRQSWTESADRGQALVAAIASAIDAGQSYEGLRDRDIGHLANVVRRDHLSDVVALPLGL